MGCWDIFCFLCGNTYHANKYLLELFAEDYDEYEKDKIQIKNFINKMMWINKCTVLTADNKIVHGCKETSCNVMFETKKSTYACDLHFREIGYLNGLYTNIGIFCHTDCWNFVKKHYGIELRYSDLPVKYTSYKGNKNPDRPLEIKYYGIEEYWMQDMNYVSMFANNDTYMVDNPLFTSSVKNISRIKKILSQLKLKKVPRPSPSVSATFYANGDIKLGTNGNFWIKQNGKWNEIKLPIVQKTFKFDKKINDKSKYKIRDKIHSIPQIAEYSNVPLFVKSFKSSKSESSIVLYGVQSTIDDFENKVYNLI